MRAESDLVDRLLDDSPSDMITPPSHKFSRKASQQDVKDLGNQAPEAEALSADDESAANQATASSVPQDEGVPAGAPTLSDAGVSGVEEVGAPSTGAAASGSGSIALGSDKSAGDARPGLDCGMPTSDLQAMAASMAQITAVMSLFLPTMSRLSVLLTNPDANTQSPNSQLKALLDGPDSGSQVDMPASGEASLNSSLPAELIESFEAAANTFKDDMVSLSQIVSKCAKFEANEIFFDEHRSPSTLTNPAGLPPGVKEYPVTTTAEWVKPFRLSAEGDFVWPTYFRKGSSRAHCIQLMHASYMHLLNSTELEVCLEKKKALGEANDQDFFLSRLHDEVSSYERLGVEAAAQPTSGIRPPTRPVVDSDIVDLWGAKKYSEVYAAVTALGSASDQAPKDKDSEGSSGTLAHDPQPNDLLKTTISHVLSDVFAGAGEAPVFLTKDMLLDCLNSNLLVAGSNWAKDQAEPWKKKPQGASYKKGKGKSSSQWGDHYPKKDYRPEWPKKDWAAASSSHSDHAKDTYGSSHKESQDAAYVPSQASQVYYGAPVAGGSGVLSHMPTPPPMPLPAVPPPPIGHAGPFQCQWTKPM
jgi:hypothetical protein